MQSLRRGHTTRALRSRGKKPSNPVTSDRTEQIDEGLLPLTLDLTPVPPYVPLAVSGDVETHLGYSPGEIIGNPNFLMNTVHPDDLPQFISALFHLFFRGYHVYEYRFLRKSGSYVRKLAHIRLVQSRSGRPLKITCSLRPPFFAVGEMLGHRSASDVVRTLSGAGVVEFTIDFRYKIRTVSSSIKDLLGYKKSDLIGVDAREMILPDYQISVHAIVVRIMEGCQDKAHFWTAAKHRNGSLRFVACELRGGFDDRGNRMIAANCQDICSLISFPKQAGLPKEPDQPQAGRDAAHHEESDLMSSLTARERDILHLTVEGFSSTEIGQHFSISPRTVEAHRASLMRKLGVRSITQLIRFRICSLANRHEG